MIHKLKKFSRRVGHGLKQEYKETIDIPKHIRNKEYKKVAEQVGDIGKMTVISVLWILPGGGVLSGVIVKFFKKMRPSAFREE